mgnify:CR=1 FL=1
MENREWLVPLDQINVVIEAIIPKLEERNTLILQGEMGAGKTSFAVSLLKKIGIQDPEGMEEVCGGPGVQGVQGEAEEGV